MFAWAQSTFDKLSEAVAPPPDDGPGRYAYAVQRGEEDNAMGCIAEFDPALTLVNQGKGIYPLHLACQYSLIRLVKLLFTQPGMMIEQTDSAGNTPLHYACMSTAPAGLECVQLLIREYRANACTKNYQGQTPYDVATMNAIRQYLLPIQLQAETQAALDNGGQGLPPGIDLGGLRIKNSNMPPPPTAFGGPPVASAPAGQFASGPPPVAFGAPPQPGAGQFSGAPPPPIPGVPPPVGQYAGAPPPVITSASAAVPPPGAGQFASGPPVAATSTGPPPAPHSGTPAAPAAGSEMFDTPTPSKKPTVAAAPASMPADISGKHGYSRVGGSSLAISGIGKYRADGFHSSSSDVGLQKKYGHASVQRYVPPPPSSGNSVPSAPLSAGAVGPNPYAGGVSSMGTTARYGAAPLARSRYVSYGPTASAPVSATTGTGYSAAYQPQAAPSAPANYTMFVPGGAAAAQQQQQHQVPYQQGATATPTSQPPPAQQHHQYPPAQSAPQQVTSAPASAPPTPSTPYMPPPPYQMQKYGTPSGNQQPSFVSPAAATYGSPNTPGGLETPSAKDMFQSPSPAFSTGTAGPSQPAITQQQPQQPSASDIFSAPSHTTSVPPAQTHQTAASSANDVFGAPPQQDSGVSNDVNDTFDKPASGQDQNAQAASSEQVEFQASTSATNGGVGQGGHVAAYPTQSAHETSTSPANVFGAAPNQAPQQNFQQPSQEPSAQQTFGAIPTPTSPYGGSPTGMNILRTQSCHSVQSAEDLFAEDAPSEVPHQQHQTTSEPVTSEASKQLFANPAPNNAADVFGAPPAAGSSSNTAAEATTMPPSGQNASESSNQATASGNTDGVVDGGGEEDDGEMVDISLTQSPAVVPRTTNTQVPTNPVAVTLNPSTVTTAAATTPADNSLFAAIGMPPPPISRR